MFSEDKRLQKYGHTFLRMTSFVIYFRKYVKYFLTFMSRQSLALVGENFHGLVFTLSSNFLMLKFNFFCNFYSLLYLRKTICWRNILKRILAKWKRYQQCGISADSHEKNVIFMFNMLLYFAEIFAITGQKSLKKAAIKKIQQVKCLVFSPSNNIFPVVFNMAET